ncbi:hypothetical protein ACY2LX_000594 [Acinetobacter baumannii]|nr:hypothetical protein [Acinetobacter baumannii]EKU3566914.1 hypothetical protein [Acinetobacter baumannii]EKU9886762.1 hypothetical protein [Acinetobacter baumannii]EKW3492968.1 hypothetical protein [Acinetobacter baumannii]EKX6441028.1 hypothetical protein [Acinetobacter baumannii]EKX9346933.1 hypothetical protein [Acinetobacter baumannii]
MTIFFLIIGTLTAFSGGKEHPNGHNIALAIMTVGCYACAVAMIKI